MILPLSFEALLQHSMIDFREALGLWLWALGLLWNARSHVEDYGPCALQNQGYGLCFIC